MSVSGGGGGGGLVFGGGVPAGSEMSIEEMLLLAWPFDLFPYEMEQAGV